MMPWRKPKHLGLHQHNPCGSFDPFITFWPKLYFRAATLSLGLFDTYQVRDM